MNNSTSILEVKDLQIQYQTRNSLFSPNLKLVNAVQGVSFKIKHEETFAVVGASGSGKTSIAMAVLGFVRPISGEIKFKAITINRATGEELQVIRRKIQPVFQDSGSSLSPRMTTGRAIEDGLWHNHYDSRNTRQKDVINLLKSVNLNKEFVNYYPKQLSVGQIQRVCIARALATKPELLILDEPLSSQDLSLQAHMMNLLAKVKKRNKLTYLLISHDLKLVRTMAHRVAIMKEGKFVELSDKESIFNDPQHSYTKSLLRDSGF